MRLARLSLAAAALIAIAACSNDATAPEMLGPSDPALNGTYFGSGMKAGSDSVSANAEATISSTAVP
jgi:hypothetical protein